jgi:pimeloyl-ACP methyl ester carboxylesterase
MTALAAILRVRAGDDPQRSEPDRRVEREWGAERFWAWRTARVEAMDPAAYVALGRALIEQDDLSPRLGAIRAPTTVLVGELDTEFRAPAAALARGIPGARLVVLPGAGHQPQHEAPAAWRSAVSEHLDRVREG